MKAPELTIRFRDLSELDSVAAQLLSLGNSVPVWLFEGTMGAGKTTLIKKLCSQLGVVSLVQSPTFALVNEYQTAEGGLIYHFDFYRIKNETEALDMGVEEYFDAGDYCFVEWPGRILSLWPSSYLLVDMSTDEEGERTVRASLMSNNLNATQWDSLR
ncbi:tRNA (adenosine(37)-N6)-threonylcarbamoyltransferase complex ATPase subunit type 1 TsaE [Telluribacter sp.]|jgi:tRNA threonylcarbamoyladenosine biosynthesis protein TsaE|uniref:tRNA (adenosine(37)-N6)-threonylcarbamoyltransferase complex ATPase subunit type 1 TsaE n=1 Tax=Telluribacter sp. TaxID=1978767 RepID=UPI002E0E21A1|nr:tRNA (adenosine(37)-N6)-threonylcarbamoyltransferase complex ATPase subunit type 1 TsaE [Telluribacter sp.]